MSDEVIKLHIQKKQYSGSLWTVVILSPSQFPDSPVKVRHVSIIRCHLAGFFFCFSTDEAYSHSRDHCQQDPPVCHPGLTSVKVRQRQCADQRCHFNGEIA